MVSKDDKNLKRIKPEKLKEGKFMFTLGLIRNDLNDLIYLQRLWRNDGVKSTEFIFDDKIGRDSGRNIFLFRLLLSFIYSFFEFLRENEGKLQSDKIFSSVFNRLNEKEKELWNALYTVATKNQLKYLKYKRVLPEIEKLATLADVARHDLTFHYYGSPKWLNSVFDEAFQSDSSRLSTTLNEYAGVMETNDSDSRSYYVDLLSQIYIENEFGKIVLTEIESKSVNLLLAPILKILNRVLFLYHRKLWEV